MDPLHLGATILVQAGQIATVRAVPLRGPLFHQPVKAHVWINGRRGRQSARALATDLPVLALLSVARGALALSALLSVARGALALSALLSVARGALARSALLSVARGALALSALLSV